VDRWLIQVAGGKSHFSKTGFELLRGVGGTVGEGEVVSGHPRLSSSLRAPPERERIQNLRPQNRTLSRQLRDPEHALFGVIKRQKTHDVCRTHSQRLNRRLFASAVSQNMPLQQLSRAPRTRAHSAPASAKPRPFASAISRNRAFSRQRFRKTAPTQRPLRAPRRRVQSAPSPAKHFPRFQCAPLSAASPKRSRVKDANTRSRAFSRESLQKRQRFASALPRQQYVG
jgi:hypothetical protein